MARCPICGARDHDCNRLIRRFGLTILTYREQRAMPMWTSNRRICVDATRTRVVPEDSPEAAFLLVGVGGQIPEEEARRYGLIGGKATEEPPETKAVEGPPEARAVKRAKTK